MATPPKNQRLLPSVVDRLLGAGGGGPPGVRGQGIREIRESIRRDLEDLMNTRWRAGSLPEGMGELEVSLANYGIPDFTGSNLGDADSQEEFRRTIQRVLQEFEPRLKRVKVILVENAEPLDRTLRFRIEAWLQTDPVPEQVVFDSTLEPLSTNFRVKEGGR
jgi:type VI secretion system protein ImpF